MKIAYQGLPGAFGHEAGLAFVPDGELVPQASFADVVQAVLTGSAARGVLPIANTNAGRVPGNAELLHDERLAILEYLPLKVRMHLLALPGVELADVRTVISHPVALAQCARLLERLHVSTEHASNTAAAAASLQERDRAVLASEAAAEFYGLRILLRDVHDGPENVTTFAMFKRAMVDSA